VVEAGRVGEEAERAVLSLGVARDDDFGSLYSYVAVDEPAVHLTPLHFCDEGARASIPPAALHDLGVASKLEYARVRWVDGIVDAGGASSLPSTHRLHDALLGLISARYSSALGGAFGRFLPTLADLYARHAMSVALDAARSRGDAPPVSLDGYVEHAMARHGPYRAPVDAVLILIGASEEALRDARKSWHSWALGVQLYDDALDAEEDYADGNPSWTVGRALMDVGETLDANPSPGADAFYEAALREGAIFETLLHAESFFEESARAAGRRFPSWVSFQQTCLDQTRGYREDLEALLSREEEGWCPNLGNAR
jgi:hypothetical protein